LSDATQDIVLSTRGLGKRYGDRWAVDGLDISVRRGDVFGFLGPNGAGKTTTIRMMLGLIKPTTGEVTINGYDAGREPLHALASVGAIVETSAFYGYMSGRRNLMLLGGLSGGIPAGRIDETLELVGLLGRADDKVKGYSQGMRQRLGLAQALLGKPDVVVLDEPTNGLDPSGIREIRALIPRLAREFGITVFISSHLLGEIEAVCTRVAVINKGSLVAEGTVSELLRLEASGMGADVSDTQRAMEVLGSLDGVYDPKIIEPGAGGRGTVAFSLSGADPSDINRALVEADVGVYSLVPRTATLEEFFLRLTGGRSGDSGGRDA
jgi:ABC-2 type transport system ATP-binding protein